MRAVAVVYPLIVVTVFAALAVSVYKDVLGKALFFGTVGNLTSVPVMSIVEFPFVYPYVRMELTAYAAAVKIAVLGGGVKSDRSPCRY